MADKDLELTARGTPRIYKPRRSEEEIAADPHGNKTRENRQLGGRICPRLRESFQDCVKRLKIQQGTAVTEAITDFLKKHNHPLPKTRDNE